MLNTLKSLAPRPEEFEEYDSKPLCEFRKYLKCMICRKEFSVSSHIRRKSRCDNCRRVYRLLLKYGRGYMKYFGGG